MFFSRGNASALLTSRHRPPLSVVLKRLSPPPRARAVRGGPALHPPPLHPLRLHPAFLHPASLRLPPRHPCPLHSAPFIPLPCIPFPASPAPASAPPGACRRCGSCAAPAPRPRSAGRAPAGIHGRARGLRRRHGGGFRRLREPAVRRGQALLPAGAGDVPGDPGGPDALQGWSLLPVLPGSRARGGWVPGITREAPGWAPGSRSPALGLLRPGDVLWQRLPIRQPHAALPALTC